MAMLIPGPAAATSTMSRRGRRSRRKSTGTGLAKPNIIRPPDASSSIAGRITVPNGSMWRSGLKVTRPSRWAVSSPSRQATAPCAASCRVTAISTGRIQVEIW